MKKLRIHNILSMICNLIIVLFTIDAFYYSFRTDVIRDEFWFGYTGVHSLRFFTVLSNLFVMFVGVIILVYNIKNAINDKYEFPKWLISLKYVATTAVSLTFLTVVVFLAPMFAMAGKGYFSLFEHNNFFMHFLTPVLAFTSFVFFERNQKLPFKQTWLAILPTTLYAIVYTIMVVFVGEANGGWADFYNFTFGGNNWVIPISASVMLLVTFGLGVLLRVFHNKRIEKIEKQQTKNS